MIKGDVFNKQHFPSNTFALFIDTFLNKKCGIVADYKNGMALSNTTNEITISSGALCIRGRFIREDSNTTINVSYQSNTYCKLIIEIDLDKVNTLSELNQVAYKIVSSETDYPTLVQTDIVKNESGIYQYELARFMCNSSGISQFTDMRTFLDFASIYEEIREHIEDIDEGSIYLLRSEADNFMLKEAASNFMPNYTYLFSGTASSGNVNLSQSKGNFRWILIDYICTRDNKDYVGSKIVPSWASYFTLNEDVSLTNGEKTILGSFTSYKLENTKISPIGSHQWQMSDQTLPVFNNVNSFKITRVIGLK